MDLNAPLGMGPRRRSWRAFALAVTVGCVALGGAGLVYAVKHRDGHHREPFTVAAVPQLRSSQPATADTDAPAVPAGIPATDATPTGSLAGSMPDDGGAHDRGSAPDPGTMENGVRVFRGSTPGSPGGAAAKPPGPLVIDVTRQLDGGPKRRLGSFDDAAGKPAAPPARPRIAIYVAGMGLSPSATRAAIDTMPPDVSLAFLPYPTPATASADAAKAKGHEVLLQLPMQNAQGGTPGPHTLKPDEPPQAVAQDLEWLMSRFGGYDGVTSLLGAPVTADTAVMTQVLKAAAAHNVFFLDDGLSKRSVAPGLGAQLNIAVPKADIVLDATNDPAVVRANFDALVSLARRNGQAIGVASGLPDHLATIARFANDLQSKNIALVPVSTLAHPSANVAAGSPR